MAEDGCVFGISDSISQLMFRRSPSNRLISSSKCAFQFKPIVDDPEQPVDWQTIMYDVNYKYKDQIIHVAILLKDNNVTDDTKFKVEGNDPNHLRSTVFHLTSSLQQDTVKSPLFSQTVTELLQKTRVLCFS
jgi:hypothetical protein